MLEELGNQAYKKALFQDFKAAISTLDKAISKSQGDPRLYNNRSYCYCRLKDYKKALEDAEFIVNKFPTYSRGYFRKAEALLGQQNYKKAELALREFLKLEPKCEEARYLLFDTQITILCENGKHWVLDAIRALKLTDHDTGKAAQFLKIGGRRGINCYPKGDIYYSDEEAEEQATSTSSVAGKGAKDPEYDPYTDPSNPLNSNSIWVGNVSKKLTKQKLRAIFSRYGKIKGEVVIHNCCAFVNYTEPKMAATAMKKFPQNSPVEGAYLIIRYPHSNYKANNFSAGGRKKVMKIK